MKKMTVFIDKSLQKEIGSGKPSTWSRAYSSALIWLGRLIAAHTDPGSDPALNERCQQNSHGAYEKLLCHYHASGGRVHEMIHDANRVEACLSVRSKVGFVLELRGYRKAERVPFSKLDLFFSLEGDPSGSAF